MVVELLAGQVHAVAVCPSIYLDDHRQDDDAQALSDRFRHIAGGVGDDLDHA
jgi:hypothetical protein